LQATLRPGGKARIALFSTALLRWLGVTPPPDLTLPSPRTVKLADDRTDEWVARFRELQTAGAPS
jgi:LPS sulfotransferase NodH